MKNNWLPTRETVNKGCINSIFYYPGIQASLVAQMVKNPPTAQETGIQSQPQRSKWLLQMPWRSKWQPTPIYLPGGFHAQRSMVGYSPWGLKELGIT